MKHCSKCGYQLSDSNLVCPACGYTNGDKNVNANASHETVQPNGGKSIFINAAEFIDDGELYNVGICKLNGIGMAKSENEAFEIFNILAFRGHTDGMCRLAEIYLKQTPPNDEVAKNWLKIASENGNKQAAIMLRMLGEKVSTVISEPRKRPGNATHNGDNFEDTVQEALNCIVAISSVCSNGSRIVGHHGSGFIIDGGFVITNAHVIGSGAKSISARFDPSIDTKEYQLTVVQVHTKYDIAVLRFKGYANDKFEDRQNLELRTEDVKIGEEVYTVGNPLILGLSLSKGVVSSPKRKYKYKGVSEVIQTDITINHGNSGGALLDKNNNVLGVMTFVPGDSEGGIGMAVPSSYIEKVLNSI